MKKSFLKILIVLILTSSCASYTLSKREICIVKTRKKSKEKYLTCIDKRKEEGKTHYERAIKESDIVTGYKDYLRRQKEISEILYQLRIR